MQQKKQLNRLFLLIEVDNCFRAKTGKLVVLFKNAENCSKVHTEWKDTYFGNPTKTIR